MQLSNRTNLRARRAAPSALELATGELERACERARSEVERFVAGEGHLVGIVSLADVAHYLNGLTLGHPLRELLLPTVARICQPAAVQA